MAFISLSPSLFAQDNKSDNKEIHWITNFDELQAKMQQAQGQNQQAPQFTVTSDTKVSDPGVSKVVNGLQAQERVITVTTKATQTPPAPNAPPDAPPISFTYVTTTDLWFAPEPPEMQQIQDVDARMYAKLSQGIDMKAIMDILNATN